MAYPREALFALAMAIIFSACTDNEVPFPYLPNLPSQYTFGPDEFLGPVAMYTYQCFSDSDQGLICQKTAAFDTARHCIDYFYRSHTTCAHLTFTYDSIGRRICETAYIDTAGTSFDSMSSPYSTTTYRYSRNSRRCIAHITGPNSHRYRFVLRYNSLGLLTRFIYPDGSRISYQYDAQGNLIKTIRPDGAVIAIDPPAVETPLYRNYVYDSHHNWIRRTTISQSQPAQLEIRTFKYYDQL